MATRPTPLGCWLLGWVGMALCCMAIGASAQEPGLTCTTNLTKENSAYYEDHVPVAISHVYSSRPVACVDPEDCDGDRGCTVMQELGTARLRRLSNISLQQCLASAGATIAFPGSTAYNNARVQYNLRNQYAPAAFVFPTIVTQVQNAICCAQLVGMGIAPRGGGHSYEEYSLGGRNGVLVVDMSGFTQLTYDDATKIAIVGAGWRLGPLYLALWNAGKVTVPAGNCPTVGVAGHALGGGWGFSSRKFGMMCDSILELQLVTANGTVVTANATQNRDLYFALRGAGATSYGIVTQFTFRMHDVSFPVTHFKYSWTNNRGVQHQNVRAWQTWAVNVVAEISASFYMDPSGRSWLEGTYLGYQSNLAPLVQPFLSAAAANPTTSVQQLDWIHLILVNAGVWVTSTTDPTTLNNVSYPNDTFKAKSIYINAPGMSDAGITAMLNAMWSGANKTAYFLFDLYGSQSAINKVAPGATAFVHRTSLYSIQMVASWNNSNDSVSSTKYVDGFYQAVKPYSDGKSYQNYVDKDMPLSAYYGSNLNALIEAKLKWDPQNVFNFPQSIPTSRSPTKEICSKCERLEVYIQYNGGSSLHLQYIRN